MGRMVELLLVEASTSTPDAVTSKIDTRRGVPGTNLPIEQRAPTQLEACSPTPSSPSSSMGSTNPELFTSEHCVAFRMSNPGFAVDAMEVQVQVRTNQ